MRPFIDFSNFFDMISGKMKTYLSAITLIGFISIAVFGFSAMAHQASFSEHGNGLNKCIAATVGGTDCPRGESPFFHLNAFKKFSTAVLAYSFFLFLGILSFRPSLLRTKDPELNFKIIKTKRDKESPPPRFKFILANWLSLHENSPAVI